jgi:hypothetical protein
MRMLVWLVSGVTLSSVAVSAQTTSDLLQRGIYVERTVGDLEEARRLYKQVIGAAPAGSDLRTSAEQRLRALDARQRQAEAAARTAGSGLDITVADGRVPLATIEGDRYQHLATGLAVQVPHGWRLRGTTASSDNGDMALFTAAAHGPRSICG